MEDSRALCEWVGHRMARVFGVLAVFVIAGCGDAGGEGARAAASDSARDTTAADEQPQRDSIALGLPTPRDPSRPAGSIGAVNEGEVVMATLEDGRIELSRDTLPPGEATVVVQNRTSSPCNIEVNSDYAGRWRSAVGPGGSVQMSMVLATSPYRVFCATGSSGAGQLASRDTARLIVR